MNGASSTTDATTPIARQYATCVEERECPGYSAQKNHAAEIASNDWILSLDADERVTPELADEFPPTLENEPAARGHRIPRAGRFGIESEPQYNRDVDALPGSDLIARGILDLSRGIESVEALVVSIGAPRLRTVGLPVARTFPGPERRLYALLAHDGTDDAHSRYNGLIRRLVSYERAAECANPQT